MSKYFSEELLQPISVEQPSGTDLRYHPLFTEIAEARRADDDLTAGDWEKEGGRKLAEWDRVAELCLAALRERTKDLRIACYLTEAAVRLDGFAGLRDCLALTVGFLNQFWDKGLFPGMEDGDLEYRAGALSWLNERMPAIVSQLPITAREGGENYTYVKYQQARKVGTGASGSAEQRETIQGLIRQGWITMDQFDAALKGTKRKALESIFEPFDEAHKGLLALEKVAGERFGDAAPTFSAAKETFADISKVLSHALKKKREEEPSEPGGTGSTQTSPGPRGSTTAFGGDFSAPADGKGWEDAEALVRAGEVDRGLSQMAGLAAQEPSGRGRFVRKLRLSDVCMANNRDRLARTILQELNQQIEDYKLDRWESSGLVGGVWSRLYKIYRKTDDSSDRDLAAKLYNQLCRLDPWQAYLSCED